MADTRFLGKAILAAFGIAYLDAKYLLSWDFNAIKSVVAAKLQ